MLRKSDMGIWENRYFRELLQRIRDIRSSERNFYQQVTDIYATAVDYDPRSDMTKTFFATVQNKLHYAVHENTAAEVIYNRVDNEKPFVGMTNFKGNYVTKDDVKIAKNYLSELELQRLNLLVSGFLDFAEFQALDVKTRDKCLEKFKENGLSIRQISRLTGVSFGIVRKFHQQREPSPVRSTVIFRQHEEPSPVQGPVQAQTRNLPDFLL